MTQRILTIIIGFSLGAAALAPSPWVAFEGDYVIGSKTLYDPPTDEPIRTHIRFRIFGEAAREMYEIIDAEPILDRCGPDHLTKLSGNIKCDFFEKGQRYACYFGVGLNENEIVKAIWC